MLLIIWHYTTICCYFKQYLMSHNNMMLHYVAQQYVVSWCHTTICCCLFDVAEQSHSSHSPVLWTDVALKVYWANIIHLDKKCCQTLVLIFIWILDYWCYFSNCVRCVCVYVCVSVCCYHDLFSAGLPVYGALVQFWALPARGVDRIDIDDGHLLIQNLKRHSWKVLKRWNPLCLASMGWFVWDK